MKRERKGWGAQAATVSWFEKLEGRELLAVLAGLSNVAELPLEISGLVGPTSLPIGGLERTDSPFAQSEQFELRSPAGNYLLRPATGNIVISASALANPALAGFVLRDNWSAVNPAPGVFDWTRLDTAVAKVVAGGKQFKLTISTGVDAPEWLYQNGVQSMTFYNDSGFRPAGTYKMPVPWDEAMLGYYDELLAELARHFGSNQNLVGVNLGGPTRFSLEMHLPTEVVEQPGYSPAAIRGAWDHVLTTYAGLFPNTAGIISLANPVYMTDGIAQQVAGDAVAILGNRATLQHAALSAKADLPGYSIHQLVGAFANLGVRTGYEELSASINPRFGGSFHTAWQELLRSGGKYLDLYQPDDLLAISFPPPAEIDPEVPQVAARHIFYNNSAFDNNTPAASAADDQAIAVDKFALLPGETASFSNYTSYSRGLNGIMVDLAGLSGTPTLADFRFRVGNHSAVDSWVSAPSPLTIDVRAGAGLGGTDRITIIWPDGAIANQWLQVTVLPTSTTNLARSDVFYFGNAIGEVGNSDVDSRVNATDEIAVRSNPRSFLDPAAIDLVFDINRDTLVNAADQILVRSHATMLANALALISPPAFTVLASSTSAQVGANRATFTDVAVDSSLLDATVDNSGELRQPQVVPALSLRGRLLRDKVWSRAADALEQLQPAGLSAWQ